MIRHRIARAVVTICSAVAVAVAVAVGAVAVGAVAVGAVAVGAVGANGVGGIAGSAVVTTQAARMSFVPANVIATRVIGTSVDGRPITAYRMGTPGGRVVFLVGEIHGDETKGSLITQLLRSMPTPVGIDMWLIDTMNPDGEANGTRTNANGVDLNRNFEVGWNYIPRSATNHQYSGEHPADQPETQAVEAFVREVRPSIGIWYHQDANTISINGARPEIPTLYGQIVGLEPGTVACSQMCTGTAGTFANRTIVGSTNFLVELPGSANVNDTLIRLHAEAVLTTVVG
jgi:protein MpaA